MKLGVIVGRFQTPFLHSAHNELIQHAKVENDKLAVFVGVTGRPPSKNNPLSYEQRQSMLYKRHGDGDHLIVYPIYDRRSDTEWSHQLDARIDAVRLLLDLTNPKVTLYGGRDSFIPRYKGRFTSEIVDLCFSGSATRLREGFESKTRLDIPTAIEITQAQFDRAMPTVDAIIRRDFEPLGAHGNISHVLLGRKKGESLWRFPGGFVDPTDTSLEAAVRREVTEETGLSADSVAYKGSFQVDDWRYRSERDKILTSVFEVTTWGSAKAGDDLEAVKWFPTADVKLWFNTNYFPAIHHPCVVPEHWPIVERFL